MKAPDLEFNYYYPFYSQTHTGKKKTYYKIESCMHLSEHFGIVISRRYNGSKMTEINIEITNNMQDLRELSKEKKLISYTAFAGEVETVYSFLAAVEKKLSKAKSYSYGLYLVSYLKFKHNLYLEFYDNHITVIFGNNFGTLKVKDYREIEKTEFDKQLDGCWGSFIEYFKCPTHINRNTYKPNK